MIQDIAGIRGIRGIGKIGEIKELGEGRVRQPTRVRIALRKRGLGLQGDPREKQALQGVPGTLPERIVWKFLESGDYVYQVQSSVMGGRDIIGGSVVDFLVYNIYQSPVAIRVMGDYWHGSAFPGTQAKDDEQQQRLSSQGYLVVDLWESDLYRAADLGSVRSFILRKIGDAL